MLGKSLKSEFLRENLDFFFFFGQRIVCRVDKETNTSERINSLGICKLTFHGCVSLKVSPSPKFSFAPLSCVSVQTFFPSKSWNTFIILKLNGKKYISPTKSESDQKI